MRQGGDMKGDSRIAPTKPEASGRGNEAQQGGQPQGIAPTHEQSKRFKNSSERMPSADQKEYASSEHLLRHSDCP